MFDDNSVVFKGKKNGIIVLLDEDIPFENLKTVFKNKITDSKKFFEGSKTAISFKGRSLSEIEENELLNIISKESDLNISFVNAGHNPKKPNNTQINLSENKIPTAKKEPTIFNVKENMTIYHENSIRSGQSVKFAGSVVVVGDVNPGGEVIAEGNVIILGNLKGLVHAGCLGNKESFVSAFLMQPTQLRIADLFTHMPTEMSKIKKNTVSPSIAYIEDGQIYVAPLV